jgi:hypothetical protein
LKERGLGFQKRLRFGAFTLSKGVKAAESGFVILLMFFEYKQDMLAVVRFQGVGTVAPWYFVDRYGVYLGGGKMT